MSIGTTIYTWIYGKIVATDEIGNKYYTNSDNWHASILLSLPRIIPNRIDL